jgi:hypothetical protein
MAPRNSSWRTRCAPLTSAWSFGRFSLTGSADVPRSMTAKRAARTCARARGKGARRCGDPLFAFENVPVLLDHGAKTNFVPFRKLILMIRRCGRADGCAHCGSVAFTDHGYEPLGHVRHRQLRHQLHVGVHGHRFDSHRLIHRGERELPVSHWWAQEAGCLATRPSPGTSRPDLLRGLRRREKGGRRSGSPLSRLNLIVCLELPRIRRRR